MKKFILCLALSSIASLVAMIWDYYYFWQNCVGCGIAPDGVTHLGPSITRWIVGFFVLGLIFFVLSYGVATLILAFKKKTKSSQN